MIHLDNVNDTFSHHRIGK